MNFDILKRLLKYQDRYAISIQFWPDQTAVYLEKGDVDLNSWGSEDPNFAITEALNYLDRINRKHEKSITNKTN